MTTHASLTTTTSEPPPLRVLVVHAPYRLRGGEDVVVEAETQLLRSHGHTVDLHLRANAELEQQAAWRQAVETVWSKTSRDRLAEHVEAFSPDVVHVHNTFPALSPSIYGACAKRGIPVVQTLHNFRLLCPQAMLLREGRVCQDCVGRVPLAAVRHGCYRSSVAASAVVAGMLQSHRMLGTWQRSIDQYIVLSEFCREIFVRGGLPAARMHVKPNFVEAAASTGSTREGFLFVGRLSEEKGLATLIDAFKRLGPQARLRAVGEGPERRRLDGHARLKPMGSLPRDQVAQQMRAAQALVVPSIWPETFGMVVIEAFASGTPVIASRIGALAELVDHGRTGLLVPPNDAQALADAMRWASEHPEAMTEMGRQARQRHAEAYSPQANHRMLTDIYRQAIALRPGPALRR